jgi:branched-chain amino acid aminotransferase
MPTSALNAAIDRRFTVELNDSATPDHVRAELLERPRFGQVFTDHMVTLRYDRSHGWRSARVESLAPLPMHPATAALHYGQEVFEGLKAHRRGDGSVVLFRAGAHAARFNRSLRRMAMPELPEDLFLAAVRALVAVDAAWVPAGEGTSLYLRPFMIATDATLGAGSPSASYLFTVIASPSGNYFGTRPDPLRVWISDRYVRAAAGGTGAAKTGGNYAASLLGLQEARDQSCDQAVWLDAAERRWVEEAGAMNLFFVHGRGDDAKLVTPPLTGTFLPGITRDSILTLAPTLGIAAVEQRVSVGGWERRGRSGELTEAFACGTAAVIAGIGEVRSARTAWQIGSERGTPVTAALRDELVGIQRGTRPDPFAWVDTVVPGSGSTASSD